MARMIMRPRVQILAFSLFLLAPVARAAETDEIRAQAMLHAMLVRSLAFAYDIEDSAGWKAHGEFWGDGTRYRVNRNDERGMLVGDKRIDPLTSSSAYDDRRYQLLTPDQSRLRLQDGNAEANYSVGTPQTFLYMWLQEIGKPFRWDCVLSHALWEEKFREARYAGKDEDHDVELEVVEIPERLQVKAPCIYKVYFAPALGYLPVKYARRVEETGEVSSTMVVEKYKTFPVDGRTLAIPTRMKYAESGADGVSFKQSLAITVDEDSLKVNEPIEESLFTLTSPDPQWIYDVDHENRMLAAVEVPSAPSQPSDRSSYLLLVVNVVGIGAIAAAWLAYRRFSGRPK